MSKKAEKLKLIKDLFEGMQINVNDDDLNKVIDIFESTKKEEIENLKEKLTKYQQKNLQLSVKLEEKEKDIKNIETIFKENIELLKKENKDNINSLIKSELENIKKNIQENILNINKDEVKEIKTFFESLKEFKEEITKNKILKESESVKNLKIELIQVLDKNKDLSMKINEKVKLISKLEEELGQEKIFSNIVTIIEQSEISKDQKMILYRLFESGMEENQIVEEIARFTADSKKNETNGTSLMNENTKKIKESNLDIINKKRKINEDVNSDFNTWVDLTYNRSKE